MYQKLLVAVACFLPARVLALLALTGSIITVFIFSPAQGAVLLIQDGFTDGGRTNGIDPLDTDWYLRYDSLASTASVAVDAGLNNNNALLVNDADVSTGTNASILGRFADGSSRTIGVGQSITLSFDFRFNNVPPNNTNSFRFGLFNDQGTAVTGDNQGASDDDRGYYAAIGSGGTGGAVLYRENSGTAPVLGGTDRTSVATGSPTLVDITDTLKHTVEMVITRNAGNVSFTVNIDGGAVEITGLDSSGSLIDTFNTVAIGNGFLDVSTGDYSIDNITVNYVPEPSSIAILTLGGLAGVWWLQKKSRKITK